MFTSLIEMAAQFSLLPIATGVPRTSLLSLMPLSDQIPSSSDLEALAISISSLPSEPHDEPTFFLYPRSGQSEDTDFLHTSSTLQHEISTTTSTARRPRRT